MKYLLLWNFAYSAWASRKLLDCCSPLANHELELELGASHSNITQTLRHIYYTERVWLRRLRAGALPPGIEIGNQSLFCDPAPEPTVAQLKEIWPEVWTGFQQYLETLPEEGFDQSLRGPDAAIPLGKLLMHTVNHSTLHRGQVITMLRQLGEKTPNIDVLSFYFEAG